MTDLPIPREREPTMEFRGRVPQHLAEEFADYFPQFGSNTWFVATALEMFMDKVRNNPTLVETLREVIDAQTQLTREHSHDRA